MSDNTRLKSFEGLPHAILNGIDYTSEDFVEGGEIAYSPRGSENEFIVRKNSDNIPALQKEDKLRSKRAEGDRIADMSFDVAAREILKKEASDLMSEGIDPFAGGENMFANGGTRMRYTPTGTLEQGAPDEILQEMTDGEQVGWTILDIIDPSHHFTGRAPSEYTNKTTQDPDSHGGQATRGTQYGKFSSQYAVPMAQGMLSGVPVVGMFADMGNASRQMAQPAVDKDQSGRHNATIDADAMGGSSGIGALGGLLGEKELPKTGNGNSFDYDPNEGLDSYSYDPGVTDPTDGTPFTEDVPIDLSTSEGSSAFGGMFGKGGVRKKYANGGSRRLTGSRKGADVAENILGLATNIVPALTYLTGDGSDYDRVRYPLVDPELVTGTAQVREARDAVGSAIEAAKDQGRIDLGALSQLATSGAKAAAGARENVANINTQILNDAQRTNQAVLMQQFADEAANKGAFQTNRILAQQEIAQAGAGTMRQQNMMENDEYVRKMFEDIFGDI